MIRSHQGIINEILSRCKILVLFFNFLHRTPLKKNARFSSALPQSANNNHANNTINNLSSKDAEAAEASTPLNPDQKANNPSLADRIKDKISVSLYAILEKMKHNDS